MDQNIKNIPVGVVPDRIYVSHDNIVVCAGPDTYHIDLKAFLEVVPWSSLSTAHGLHWHDHYAPVRERISATYSKNISGRDGAL